MELTIVSTKEEAAELARVDEAYSDYIAGKISKKEFKERTPRKVWLEVEDWSRPGPCFMVCDNRDGECLVEEFFTLDGAILWASDVYTSTEKADEWDKVGQVAIHGSLVAKKED